MSKILTLHESFPIPPCSCGRKDWRLDAEAGRATCSGCPSDVRLERLGVSIQEKPLEARNMSERIAEIVSDIMRRRNEVLEEFCRAHLAETGLMPSQVELVEQMDWERRERKVFFRSRPSQEGSPT